ncbi:hypothetical protein HDU86_004154 [Geranomyces michiganensis]|nr:hypothetical protein HDU86_004154 [Geranomyces michiganensis]
MSGPVTLAYVGCTIAAAAELRQKRKDKSRVSTLVQVARQLEIDIAHQAFELDRIATNGSRVATDIEHVEAVARMVLGPLAHNSSPGGRHHIITLSPSTAACIDALRSESIATTFKMLGERQEASMNLKVDAKIKKALAAAYQTIMPRELRQELPNAVLELAVKQSCELQSFYGSVVAATLGKDIPIEAFKELIPFFAGDRAGPGPQLIVAAERIILGSTCTKQFLRVIAKGPFRDLWEILSHILWKEAQIWLGAWLNIIKPLTTFAMGRATANAILDFLPVEQRPHAGVPFFHLVGRPTIVLIDGSSATILIACIDPGKAKYNPLTQSFEIELVTICKAIHMLVATIVAELIIDHRGEHAKLTTALLTDKALPRILSAMNQPGGLTFARNRVCRQLERLYSTAVGHHAEGTGAGDKGTFEHQALHGSDGDV